MQQIKKGYSNRVEFYGTVTDIYKTKYNVTFGVSVEYLNDPLGSDYPRVIFYAKETELDRLIREYPAGTFVKITAHIQTQSNYKEITKNVSYQTIVGDDIQKIIPDYAPQTRNSILLNGYVSNVRVPEKNQGIVRLTILTKRNAHDAHIHAIVYTRDRDDITDRIRINDFIYTIGAIQTRRIVQNGIWSNYEDYVVRRIFRATPENKLRILYSNEERKENQAAVTLA